MINVVPINPWELFKIICTGTMVSEFNNILFKARGKTFEFIQADFNKNICLADESSNEFKDWKGKNISGSWRGKVTQ